MLTVSTKFIAINQKLWTYFATQTLRQASTNSCMTPPIYRYRTLPAGGIVNFYLFFVNGVQVLHILGFSLNPRNMHFDLQFSILTSKSFKHINPLTRGTQSENPRQNTTVVFCELDGKVGREYLPGVWNLSGQL